jgi:hypothetical protein
MAFVALPHTTDRCCQRRVILTLAGGSYEQHGQPVSTHGAAARNMSASLESCQQHCARTADCTFVSFSSGPPTHCQLCASCELLPSFDGRIYSSFVRVAAPSTIRHFKRVDPTAFPAAALQGAYSRALYGAPDRVPLQSLRLVWLDLLPPAALGFATAVGVCQHASMPPLRPFMIIRDSVGRINPRDALWVRPPEWSSAVASSAARASRRALSGAAMGATHRAEGSHDGALAPPPWATSAVPSHAWVEVTHCPQAYAAPADLPGPAWKVVRPPLTQCVRALSTAPVHSSHWRVLHCVCCTGCAAGRADVAVRGAGIGCLRQRGQHAHALVVCRGRTRAVAPLPRLRGTSCSRTCTRLQLR